MCWINRADTRSISATTFRTVLFSITAHLQNFQIYLLCSAFKTHCGALQWRDLFMHKGEQHNLMYCSRSLYHGWILISVGCWQLPRDTETLVVPVVVAVNRWHIITKPQTGNWLYSKSEHSLIKIRSTAALTLCFSKYFLFCWL